MFSIHKNIHHKNEKIIIIIKKKKKKTFSFLTLLPGGVKVE